MSNQDNIIDVVRQALTARGLSPEIIQNTQFHVKRAVMELQRRQVLPPVSWEFIVEDQKDERRNGKGELMYYYIKLPEDFAELSELFVDGKDPYHYTSHINYLSKSRAEACAGSSGVFSIEKLNLENGTLPVFVMPMDPFPEDDRHVKITYFADGSMTDYDWLRPEHWEAVISQVEYFLGITRQDVAADRAFEAANRWKNARGNQYVNRTMLRIKNNRLFGK